MRRLFVLLLTVLTLASVFADPVDVFIFSGQSNMAGAAKVADLDDAQRQPLPLAKFWNGESFEVLSPGTTKLGSDNTRFGPELAFAQHYATSGATQHGYLIKYAVGGRPLHAGWDGGKWQGEAPGPGRSTFYPGEKPGDPNTGVLYTKLVEITRAALAQLKEQGIDFRVRGVLWMQGEADAKNEISAREYAKSLKQWHQRLFEDIGVPPCPLVYGQVLPYSPPAERFTHRDEVRQSQANLDHESGHPDAYPWAFMVPTEGMALADDTVHYTAAGQLALGQAFAQRMAAALVSAP